MGVGGRAKGGGVNGSGRKVGSMGRSRGRG